MLDVLPVLDPAQYVIPLDVQIESCAVCDATGRWTDKRGQVFDCSACVGRGVVAFESFELVRQ